MDASTSTCTPPRSTRTAEPCSSRLATHPSVTAVPNTSRSTNAPPGAPQPVPEQCRSPRARTRCAPTPSNWPWPWPPPISSAGVHCSPLRIGRRSAHLTSLAHYWARRRCVQRARSRHGDGHACPRGPAREGPPAGHGAVAARLGRQWRPHPHAQEAGREGGHCDRRRAGDRGGHREAVREARRQGGDRGHRRGRGGGAGGGAGSAGELSAVRRLGGGGRGARRGAGGGAARAARRAVQQRRGAGPADARCQEHPVLRRRRVRPRAPRQRAGRRARHEARGARHGGPRHSREHRLRGQRRRCARRPRPARLHRLQARHRGAHQERRLRARRARRPCQLRLPLRRRHPDAYQRLAPGPRRLRRRRRRRRHRRRHRRAQPGGGRQDGGGSPGPRHAQGPHAQAQGHRRGGALPRQRRLQIRLRPQPRRGRWRHHFKEPNRPLMITP